MTGVLKECAAKANEILKLGLDENSYIKTGGYKRHTNVDKQLHDEEFKGIDPDNLERNENDFSFNYSAAVFSMDKGDTVKG